MARMEIPAEHQDLTRVLPSRFRKTLPLTVMAVKMLLTPRAHQARTMAVRTVATRHTSLTINGFRWWQCENRQPVGDYQPFRAVRLISR